MIVYTTQDIVNGIGVRSTALATIASGASLSGAVDCGEGWAPVGIGMPTAWTAADLSFQVSEDGATWREMMIDAKSAAASGYVPLSPANWCGVRYLKVRSGTSGTPVNQAAERVLTVRTARLV